MFGDNHPIVTERCRNIQKQIEQKSSALPLAPMISNSSPSEKSGVEKSKKIIKETFKMAPTIKPSKGKHSATVIFLHGLGDNGNGWASILADIRQRLLLVLDSAVQSTRFFLFKPK